MPPALLAQQPRLSSSHCWRHCGQGARSAPGRPKLPCSAGGKHTCIGRPAAGQRPPGLRALRGRGVWLARGSAQRPAAAEPSARKTNTRQRAGWEQRCPSSLPAPGAGLDWQRWGQGRMGCEGAAGVRPLTTITHHEPEGGPEAGDEVVAREHQASLDIPTREAAQGDAKGDAAGWRAFAGGCSREQHGRAATA